MTRGVEVHGTRPRGGPWATAEALLSAEWLEVMVGRPPGQPLFFTCNGPSANSAATLGYWIEDPSAYAPFNWYDLVWGQPPVFRGQADIDAESAPRRELCFPALVIVQPGYDCSACGDDALLPELVSGIVAWSRSSGAAAVAALYTHGPLADALHQAGFRRYTGSERAVLVDFAETRWPARLGRNGRRQIASDLAVLSANQIRYGLAEFGGRWTEEVLRLRRALVAKYGSYATDASDRRTLDLLVDTYGWSRLRLFLARDAEGRVVGFSLFTIDSGTAWSSFWVGSEGGRDTPADRAYFGCLFYAPVRVARAQGVERLDLGLGLDEAKVRRGCIGLPRAVDVLPLSGGAGLAPPDHLRAVDVA